MKVVIISRNRVLPHGTTQLRCIQPLEYLQAQGIDVVITELTKYKPADEEVLILHRVTGSLFNRSIVQYAQARNIKVVYDTDDLIFHTDGVSYLSKLGLRKYFKEKDNIAKIIAECDAVSVSTSPLIDYAKKLNNQTFLIKNALSYSFFKNATTKLVEKKKNKMVTIAYLSGSGTHDKDFSIISEGLFRLLKDFPFTELLIVGPLNIDDKFKVFGDRLIIKRFMPYEEFQNVFNFIDINLIPLEKSEAFCQCKSELKFIEAGINSTPSIATPTVPYRETIINGVNGMLSEDEKWYEKIKVLLDEKTRVSIGESAFNTVFQAYSPSIREQDWKSVLTQIQMLEVKTISAPVFFIQFKFHFFKMMSILYENQKSLERYIRKTIVKK